MAGVGADGEPLAPGLALGFLRKAASTWLLLTVNSSLPGPCHQAGKFDIIPTMTTIGSGIGIFGVVSVRITGPLCQGLVPPPHLGGSQVSHPYCAYPTASDPQYVCRN